MLPYVVSVKTRGLDLFLIFSNVNMKLDNLAG